MDLQSQLIQKVMNEAGQRIATIDRNRGTIAECESLTDALNRVNPDRYTSLVTVHDDTITARIQTHFTRLSMVYADIAQAGLVAEPDIEHPYLDGFRLIALAGCDVPIHVDRPDAELKAA